MSRGCWRLAAGINKCICVEQVYNLDCIIQDNHLDYGEGYQQTHGDNANILSSVDA